MKSNKIDPIEVKGTPERRVSKGFSYFRLAKAQMEVVFIVIGLLTAIYFVGYLGVKGGINEVARQGCESLQAYVTDFPDSVVPEAQITKCGALGIEIK